MCADDDDTNDKADDADNDKGSHSTVGSDTDTDTNISFLCLLSILFCCRANQFKSR